MSISESDIEYRKGDYSHLSIKFFSMLKYINGKVGL